MVHDVLDVPVEAGREALERLLASGVEVGPVAQSGDGRMLFFTLTRGTPEDEDEWWPCELDSHPETTDEHPVCAGTAGARMSSCRRPGCPAA